MSNQHEPKPDPRRPPVDECAKNPYRKPMLTCFGEIREVTLGPTIEFGESGQGGINFRIQ